MTPEHCLFVLLCLSFYVALLLVPQLVLYILCYGGEDYHVASPDSLQYDECCEHTWTSPTLPCSVQNNKHLCKRQAKNKCLHILATQNQGAHNYQLKMRTKNNKETEQNQQNGQNTCVQHQNTKMVKNTLFVPSLCDALNVARLRLMQRHVSLIHYSPK